jgi:hypothetical protein
MRTYDHTWDRVHEAVLARWHEAHAALMEEGLAVYWVCRFLRWAAEPDREEEP